MPERSRDNPPHRRTGWVGGVILVLLLSGAAAWWWPRSKVSLDHEQYEVTLALYRVCNQRSAAGLEQIEQRLERLRSNSESDPQQTALSRIVDTARSGEWRSASKACRELLDDQVQR